MDKTKKLKKRNRRRRRLLVRILFITMWCLFLYFFLNSSFFDINTIKVLGNHLLGQEELIEISKIHKGENIFKVKTNLAEEELEKQVYIKKASVKRNLPNKILIQIIEREEKILLQHITSYLVVDEEGIILDLREGIDVGLLLVKGINNKNISIGANIFEDFKEDEIREFFYTGEKIGLFADVVEIDMEIGDNITIKLKDGLAIDFGAMDNVKYKLGMINEILQDKKDDDIKYRKIIMNKGTHPILVIDE